MDGTAVSWGMLLIETAAEADDGSGKGIGESLVCNAASLIV